MLGLADRTRVIELFDQVLRGEAPAALETLADMHRMGADPLQILQDMLDFTHFLTRSKLIPQVLDDPAVPEAERARGKALAEGLGVPVLTRCWQMLLKGVTEVQMAPQPEAAVEMVLIRLMHAAHLPTPGEVIRKLEAGAYDGLPALDGPAPGGAAPAGPSGGSAVDATGRPQGGGSGPAAGPTASRAGLSVVARAERPEPEAEAPPASAEPAAEAAPAISPPADFRGLADLFEAQGRPDLRDGLYTHAHLVRYDPAAGRLEFRPGSYCPRHLAQEVGRLLIEWTGRRWMVSLSDEPGEATLAQQEAEVRRSEMDRAREHPVVAAVLARFPGARLVDVRPPEDDAPAESVPGLPLAAEGTDDDMEGVVADPTAPPPEDED
jgi:DNA polymerase-3 subunit gamma/tau